MSSFLKKCINPKTGEEQVAFAIDNYWGRRRYGYGFPKDGSDASMELLLREDIWDNMCDFYKESEI